MPPDTGAEKTEQPTQHKIDESRGRGQVSKSQDLNSALVLLVSLLAFYFMGPSIADQAIGGMRQLFYNAFGATSSAGDLMAWEEGGEIFTQEDVYAAFPFLMWWVIKTFGLFFLAMVVIGFLTNIIQVGFLFTTTPLEPDIGKISPLKGLKNIFSMRGLVRLFTSVLKIYLVGVVVYYVVLSDLERITSLNSLEVGGIFGYGAWLTFKVGIWASIILLVMGIVDFVYNKWQHTKDLRMTKQEVKDELKQFEGDPQVKQRRRKAAQEMAKQRMMSAVPEADVVITNPEHYAVAVVYDLEKMSAPKVIAKGMDNMAQQIKKIAKDNKITTVENVALARALFKHCDIGDSVPDDYFKAVAEILVTVYQADKRLAHKLKTKAA